MNINVYAGDTKKIVFNVKDELGNPMSLSGAFVEFVLKKGYRVKETVLTKTSAKDISISDGRCTVILTSQETSKLEGSYEYACRIRDSLGDTSTVDDGELYVMASKI